MLYGFLMNNPVSVRGEFLDADAISRDASPTDFVPCFGTKMPGINYVVRPGAYAVIFDGAGAVAAVAGPGGYYLPGGGIESGESEEEAVRRELMEECSASIEILEFLGQATDYLHAGAEGAYFEKRGGFFRARFVSTPTAVEWISQEEVSRIFRQGGHVWAVTRCVEKNS